jgi:hypothetical protein
MTNGSISHIGGIAPSIYADVAISVTNVNKIYGSKTSPPMNDEGQIQSAKIYGASHTYDAG